MNREHILAAVPHGDQFEQLQPRQKQSTTIDLAQVMLTAVEADGRELDEWEGLGLLEALGAIYCNQLTLALVRVEHALVGPDGRSEMWQPKGVKVPSIQELRSAFESARHRPVQA